jgi:Zn-dependent peptidase ImmA (M78 family)
MDNQLVEVGQRIRESLGGMTQRALADAAGITPDALSRALNASRGFSLSEITRISRVLSVDVAWLITGAPDPHHVQLAARHAWDPAQRQRSNPGEHDDSPLLSRIGDLYRAAFPDAAPSSRPLPATAADARTALGEGFVRRFAESIEQVFDVDIIRIPDLSTAYSMRVGDRGVIVLPTTPNWFRSNWSLAHEFAHLALGHHDASDQRTGTRTVLDRHEKAANAFAAELLLPQRFMRALPWSAMSIEQLGVLLWTTGVSTQTLKHRSANLNISMSGEVAEALDSSTFDALHSTPSQLQSPLSNRFAIADRRQQAAAMRYPLALVESITGQVERGAADPQMLADVLNISVDEVYDTFEVPPEESDAEIAERLLNSDVQSPTAFELDEWIARTTAS